MMGWKLAKPCIWIFHGLASMVYGVESDAAMDADMSMFNTFTTANSLVIIFFHYHAYANWQLR